MGRHRAINLVGKCYLRTGDRKVDKNGNYTVHIEYGLRGLKATVSTDIKIPQDCWNADKCEVTRKHPLAFQYNNKLRAQLNALDSAIFEYRERHKGVIDINILRGIVSGKLTNRGEKENFVAYTERMIEERYNAGKIHASTHANQKSCMARFRRFLLSRQPRKETLPIEELTVKVIEDFIEWKRDYEGNSEDSINKSLTPIKQAARKAADEGILEAKIATAINNLSLSNEEDVDGDPNEEVKYLTMEQLKAFIDLRLHGKFNYEATYTYMDMFLFSYFAWGLRVSDLVFLEWKQVDLKKKEIRKIVYKTKRPICIHLCPDAIKILEAWHERTGKKRFVFGLLEDDVDLTNGKELNRLRNNKERPISTSLTTIGRKLGIKDFNLTMHNARHTFAIHALNEGGVEMGVVSAMLGHLNIATTEKSYAKFIPSKLKDIAEEKLNFDLL